MRAPSRTRCSSTPQPWVVPLGLMLVALAGCGANKLSESSEGLDFAGTSPWRKVDQLPDRSNALGIQSVSLAARLGDRIHDPFTVELVDGSAALYFTSDAQGVIGRTHATAVGFDWEEPTVVLRATEAWERGRVGGLSVIERNGRFEAWYGGGDGGGIGRALSADAIRWTKDPTTPVLVAEQSWEAGAVRAPSVAATPDGRLWMAYEVGDGAAIGLAVSDDGVVWSRTRETAGSEAIVERGDAGAWHEARVAAPALRIERTATGRTVFRLWFEGMAGNDFSIGEAASYDGSSWTLSPYNPVLAEAPPLTLTIGADEREPWITGDAGARRLWFAASQLDPPAQGIGQALDHSP